MAKLTEVEAYRKAHELVGELGSGWQPRIWQNMGWHYAAHFQGLRVSPCGHHPDREARWMCLQNDGDGSGGKVGWSGRGDTPKEAVLDALDKAAKYLDRWNGAYEKNRQATLEWDA